MTPVVSIIVPCYNAARWVVDTLSSALQPTACPVEVVVVDDGSTDGSGDLISDRFPTVRLICTPNRGVSHARNLGIAEARGRFLLFLDADDLLTPGAIDRQVAVLEESGSDVVHADWQRLRAGLDGEYRPAEIVARVMLGEPSSALFRDFWCPTGAYLYRRTIVEAVGGFSPRLPVIQDARFALDCALHGGRFAHASHVACLYRTHPTGSVSTHSQTAFVQDCLTNALDVRDWLAARGELTQEQVADVVYVLDHVARAAVGIDMATFETACREIVPYLKQAPPPARRAVRWLTQLIGYRRVRQAAGFVQRWKANCMRVGLAGL